MHATQRRFDMISLASALRRVPREKHEKQGKSINHKTENEDFFFLFFGRRSIEKLRNL